MRHSAARFAISLKSGTRCWAVASMSRTISSSDSFSLKILTAFIGSPTYFGLANLTVLTRPPSCTSRQGMILGRSILELSKVLQELLTVVMALLGMKLGAIDVARRHGAGELHAVLRRRGD